MVGSTVLVTTRSRSGVGPGGGEGTGGGVGGVGGVGGGVGGAGGVGGVGGVPFRVFVNVQTTMSPFATAPSTFVPGTESSMTPFRVHSTFES